MKFDFVRKELFEYINTEIKPMYKNFDRAHNQTHFKFVVENCVCYGKELIKKGIVIDLEIAFVVGAFHDIGICMGRENHAKSSGEIVRKNEKLKDFFNAETIEMIAQAVEDHSSHLEYEPRSVYGKIVADADRNNTAYLVFSRPIKYGLRHEKYLSREQQIERVYNFVQDKFGRSGYVKYWLDIPQTTQEQQQVWDMLDRKEECKKYIAGLFDEATKGKYKQEKNWFCFCVWLRYKNFAMILGVFDYNQCTLFNENNFNF